MGSSGQIIVGAYRDSVSAHMVRIQLEAAGIEAWVVDEHTASANPLYSPLIGGIKLAVYPEDEMAARELLSGLDEVEEESALATCCPHCGSERVGKNGMGFFVLLALTLLTFGLYLPFFYRGKRCEACGRTF